MKIKINKSAIPSQSLTMSFIPADYTDCYSCRIRSERNITPDDIQVAFWTTKPAWVEALFKLRNILVRPFGLEGDNPEDNVVEKAIREGEKTKVMTIVGRTAQETVLRLDDKHLAAYLSVRIDRYDENIAEINVITVIQYHNALGRAYFALIRPFHHLLVKSNFRSAVRNLYGFR